MHFRHRQTDGLASWHKREMYILHLALKTGKNVLDERSRSDLLRYRVKTAFHDTATSTSSRCRCRCRGMWPLPRPRALVSAAAVALVPPRRICLITSVHLTMWFHVKSLHAILVQWSYDCFRRCYSVIIVCNYCMRHGEIIAVISTCLKACNYCRVLRAIIAHETMSLSSVFAAANADQLTSIGRRRPTFNNVVVKNQAHY